MRKIALAAALLAMLVGSAARADAATITVVLNVHGTKEIDIPIEQPPLTEFEALDSSWGSLTLDGSPVGFYVWSVEDKIHAANQFPTGNYPYRTATITIRVLGLPTQVLILNGVTRPPAEGGGIMGGVTVATGPFASLHGASFILSGTTLTFTF